MNELLKFLEALLKFLVQLSPVRAPLFSITSLTGLAVLIWLGFVNNPGAWYFVTAPIFVIWSVCVLFAADPSKAESADTPREQLTSAALIGICGSALCIVLLSTPLLTRTFRFWSWVTYCACLLHLAAHLRLLSRVWASPREGESFNQVQLSAIGSQFVGFSSLAILRLTSGDKPSAAWPDLGRVSLLLWGATLLRTLDLHVPPSWKVGWLANDYALRQRIIRASVIIPLAYAVLPWRVSPGSQPLDGRGWVTDWKDRSDEEDPNTERRSTARAALSVSARLTHSELNWEGGSVVGAITNNSDEVVTYARLRIIVKNSAGEGIDVRNRMAIDDNSPELRNGETQQFSVDLYDQRDWERLDPRSIAVEIDSVRIRP